MLWVFVVTLVIALFGAWLWLMVQQWAVKFQHGLRNSLAAEFGISIVFLGLAPGVPFVGIVIASILLTLVMNSISAFYIWNAGQAGEGIK